MNKQMKRLCLLLWLAITHVLIADEWPLDQLKLVADGLNIEGGTIPQKYLQQGQIWANLCVILDRPFETGLEWQQLTNLNSFPLKEASILDYNEAQVNFVHAILMHYYITHARQMINKGEDQTIKLMIQVHRNTSGPRHLELLERLLLECYPELEGIKQVQHSSSRYELFTYVFSKLNVEVIFCYGSKNLEELIDRYREMDIVLSLSLVAGLHPSWQTGSLLVAETYLPFSLRNVVFSPQAQYCVRNHLKEVIPTILQHQEERILTIINDKFRSLNCQKHDLQAKLLTIDDFKEATLLQVDGDFNPSELPPTFKWDISDQNKSHKVVVITGASQGIGYEIAQLFANRGWSVWAGTRNPSKLKDKHANIHAIFLDVTDTASIQKAIRKVFYQEGKIDVLINNASYVLLSPLEIDNVQEVKDLFDVNFWGAIRATSSVLPFMRYQKKGHIINLSSTAGIQAVPGLGYFSASKFALEGYSEALAAELNPWEIKVSIVEPGSVNTSWINNCFIRKDVQIPEYVSLIKALYKRMLQSSCYGQKSIDVAKLILSIVETPLPQLRYQTSERAQLVAANRWVDPTGMQYLKEQIDFLRFLNNGDLNP
jgi:NADP-dependent 3-hydroxy acid dehydrogenase YdfG